MNDVCANVAIDSEIVQIRANLLLMRHMLQVRKLMLVLVVRLVLLLMVMVRMMRRLQFHFMIGQAIVFGRMNWTE